MIRADIDKRNRSQLGEEKNVSANSRLALVLIASCAVAQARSRARSRQRSGLALWSTLTHRGSVADRWFAAVWHVNIEPLEAGRQQFTANAALVQFIAGHELRAVQNR